ncbi:MAG TPA: hypothetical protein VFO16_09860 [Pseudonocardiaceae bacterium]|nr:hypothetical protein [Pseudonocardiaceae bacterium]
MNAARTGGSASSIQRPYLDYLAGLVGLAVARSMQRQVIALADEVLALPDDQLRARLVDLAWTARPGAAVADNPHFAPEAPAGLPSPAPQHRPRCSSTPTS